MRDIKRKNPKTGKTETSLAAPVWTNHADFCHPFEFIAFLRQAEGLTFDVMLEAKAKDLALLRLRSDLLAHAPDVARRFGLSGPPPVGDDLERFPTCRNRQVDKKSRQIR